MGFGDDTMSAWPEVEVEGISITWLKDYMQSNRPSMLWENLCIYRGIQVILAIIPNMAVKGNDRQVTYANIT